MTKIDLNFIQDVINLKENIHNDGILNVVLLSLDYKLIARLENVKDVENVINVLLKK
ncbi:hypothetical protein EOM39_00235 [Candidatus Gracilibacteria bacterium]|nr:hypothetical protein [Candidatus Gracilibacteria bacterium]